MKAYHVSIPFSIPDYISPDYISKPMYPNDSGYPNDSSVERRTFDLLAGGPQ
jgi:hypothetical protein